MILMLQTQRKTPANNIKYLAVFQTGQELPQTVMGTSKWLKEDEFSKAAVSYALHLPERINALFTNKEDNL